MKDLLKRIIKLAADWRDFSKATNGWVAQYFCNETVKCYFASNSDFSVVFFKINDLEEISVNFHSVPSIDGFRVESCDLIDNLLTQYTVSLSDLKSKEALRSKDDVENEKQIKIAELKRQLEILEEKPCKKD